MTLLLGAAETQLETKDWDSTKWAYGPTYVRDIKDHIVSEFEIGISELEGVEILAYYSSPSDYEMSCWYLIRKNGELFEVDAGHCSCYGYEGQWEPKPTSLTYIFSDKFSMDYHSDASDTKLLRDHLAPSLPN